MFASMAGQTITGAAVASTVAPIGSSASPSASFAMVCAVAGAIITTSARSAMATWSISSSERGSNRLSATGRWVIAAKVRGATNSLAAGVIITSTSAPSCTSLLARSTAL